MMKTNKLPVRSSQTAEDLMNKRHVLINEYKYSTGLICLELLSNTFTKILIDSIILYPYSVLAIYAIFFELKNGQSPLIN
jgi:hypothetical protein